METSSFCESEEGSLAYEGDVSFAESCEGVDMARDLFSAASDAENSTFPAEFTSTTRSGISTFAKPKPISRVKSGHIHKRAVVNARDQAKLIQAKAKIIQLESELSSLRQSTKAAHLQTTDFDLARGPSEKGDHERLHQLECERCTLLDELSTAKDKLTNTESELEDKTMELQQLSDKYTSETKESREEVEKLIAQCDEMEVMNDELMMELNQYKEANAELDNEAVQLLQMEYEKAVETMRARLEVLECVESKLHHSEAQMKEMEAKLRLYRQDSHFAGTWQEKLLNYSDLERQVKKLSEENQVLRQSRDNADLLRYRVQALQEKCSRLEDTQTEVARLELENKQLRTECGAGEGDISGASHAALQYKLTQLQQKEVLLMSKQGELQTSLKLREKEIAFSDDNMQKLKSQLALEEDNNLTNNERILKLEKKLLFVTKERDGCVNVLNSYQLDAGVDALLKERIAELERQVQRDKQRIAMLEGELDTTSVVKPKKKSTSPEHTIIL